MKTAELYIPIFFRTIKYFCLLFELSCLIIACETVKSKPGAPGNYSVVQSFDSLNSGLPCSSIRSITFDNFDNPWIATCNCGVVHYDGSNWHTYSVQNTNIANDTIWDMAFDGNSNLWVATSHGLSMFNGTHWHTYDSSNSPLPLNTIFSIAVDSSNTLWIGCGNALTGGLVSFSDNQWQAFTPENSSLPCRIINDIAVDTDNRLWVATSQFQSKGGLAIIDDTNWVVYNKINSALPYNDISTIAIDNHGKCAWIGMKAFLYDEPGFLDGALCKIDYHNSWEQYFPSQSGTSSNRVTALCVDLDGNLWVATSVDESFGHCISLFDYKEWIPVSNFIPELKRISVPCISVNKTGHIWIASNRGVHILGKSR